MTSTPSKIWINVPHKDAPDWIVERMTDLEIAADGTFEIEASDGVTRVQPGFAVFEINEHVYACPPRLMQDKLAIEVGSENEVVVELVARVETGRTIERSKRIAQRQLPLAKARGDRPLRLKPMVGVPPAPQFAELDKLQVDDSYQRSIEGGSSQKLIVKIAENWDWRLCLPLIVSRRQGNLYVIDGQHRLEGARLRGDIYHLPIVVFDFDDPKAEAELFVQANRSRRTMSALDDFHAAVVAGDAKAIAANDVVTAAGLQVGRIQAWQYWKPGEVVFVKAIERNLRTAGTAVVEQALGMVARAFEGLVLVGVGSVFEGVCSIVQQRAQDNAPFDTTLMVAVLKEVGIPGWKEAVASVDTGPDRAETMLRALNDAYAEAEKE